VLNRLPNWFTPTAIVLLATMGVTQLLLLFGKSWVWAQIPFHSFIEALGSFIAITVAVTLLVLRRFAHGLSAYIWIASGLIAMGVLDCFHAMVIPGKEFVWLHSLSNFWGGLLFACVWLPERLSAHKRIEMVPVWNLLATLGVGLYSLFLPESLPSMGGEEGFTTLATVLNVAGGFGFVVAAIYFAVSHESHEVDHSPVLLNHCLLFGLSGLLFASSSLWDAVWWEWHLLRLAAYGVILYFFIITYRSERQRVENEFKRLSLAVQYSGEAIMMTNTRGMIVYVNPAFTEITGYAAEEAIGRDPSLLKSNAQDPDFYQELWRTISQGKVWNGTLIDRKKDGSFFPAMMSIAPIRGEDGQIIQYVSLLRDMTEHQRLEDQFRQAQKMESIGTLVGGIAHDFNNMLAAIDGNIYLASQSMDDRADLEKRLQSIEMLSSRAAEIVRQLLAYARKDLVMMEALSLNACMEEAYELTRSSVPENIAYRYEGWHELLKIRGDVTQLQQILMNLINNARKAVEDRAKPAISCTVSRVMADKKFMRRHSHLSGNDLARITVQDNGAGISSDNLEKVFEPFFTTRSVGEGTGLGLSMVYGSVQRHGGAIEVESRLGEGSSFHIFLPLIDVPDMAETPYKDSSIGLGHGEMILLVDDQEELLRTTSKVLRGLNYQVIEAVDGEDALKKFEDNSETISLVFTDIVMPKLGGVELMKRVWNIRPDVPVIYVTGYSNAHHDIPNERDSLILLLTKPYSFSDIGNSIQSLLSR